MKLSKNKLALATVLVLQQWPAHQAGAQQIAKLDEITVTSTRGTSGDISRAAATVSVVTAEEMERQNAKDIKDALRYEPGVDVRRSVYRVSLITGSSTTTGRGANEGISIRGLDGNRVLLLEDGISLPRAFSQGTLSAGRGSYTNTDLYQRIEILRGPASSMYGSDGLTGAVNFVTKDPQDYLTSSGKNTYFSLRPSYDSVDSSYGTTGTAVFGGDRWQGMLVLDARHGNEADNKGDKNIVGVNRTTPDPLTYDTRSALGKLVFKPTALDTFKLTLQSVDSKLRADSLSAIGTSAQGAIVTGYKSKSDVESNRVGLIYERDDAENPYVQKIRGNVYYREAQTHQQTFENGNSGVLPRYRDIKYSDNILGGGVLAESAFDTGAIKHKLVYGFDASLATLKVTGMGTGWSTCTGVQSCEYFPKTEYSVFGAYVQDEMRFGSLSVIPGLRYDAYKIDPKASAKYDAQAIANGQPASSSKDSALSPRLAVAYDVSPALIPYAQYARGFRSPSPHEVNSYFNNSAQGYSQIANPNLKPETSNSYEIGLKGKLSEGNGEVRYSLAAFAGEYKNFIDSVTINAPIIPQLIQYINASKASIHGFEGRLDWRLDSGWGVKTGFAYTEGTTTNQKGVKTGLESVAPLSVVAGLRYEPNQTWYVQGDVIYNAAKKRKDVITATSFLSPSYTIADVRAGYRFNKNVSFSLGIRNLFDRKYWNWNDVRGLSQLTSTSLNRDAFTSPGRSIAASLKIEY